MLPVRHTLLPWLAALAALVAGAGLTELGLRQEIRQRQQQQQQHMISAAGEVRAVFEAELNASLHLTSGLAAYIESRQGELHENEMEPWLGGLLQQGRHIRNLGIAPGNRIAYIYPRQGNEAALGLYYPDHPLQWPAVAQAIKLRRPVLAGPVDLRQGGRGLVYRVPVFLKDGRYWGIISTVINADTLSQFTRKLAHERGLQVALLNNHGLDAVPRFLLGNRTDVEQASTTLTVTVPGGNWLLAVRPQYERSSAAELANLRLAGWLLSLAAAALLGLLLRANARSQRMAVRLSASQRRFARVFETAPQGMALLDNQGRWLDLNDVMCQLLGYERRQLRQQTLTAMLAPEDRPAASAALQAMLDGQERQTQLELRLLAHNGSLIDVLCSMARVDAEPSCLVAQFHDLREYKRLERMKSEFVSIVSHELRTPLTSIVGSLGLCTSGMLGSLPPGAAQVLEIAQKNSLRLGELINDLLDMEKLAAGKMTFDLHPQPLQPILDEALQSNQAYADTFHVQLVLEQRANCLVMADSLRLQQVLSNYLSNAAKFAPSGSQVHIEVNETDDRVRVSVRDHGPGIPEAFKARIFQKFSQADSSDTRQKGGTGLGLAITRELMERMGGTVGFTSAPGQGACFWFELPCSQPDTGVDQTSAPAR